MADRASPLGLLAAEDVVLIDTVIIVVTAPVWVAWFAVRLVVAVWSDGRARG